MTSTKNPLNALQVHRFAQLLYRCFESMGTTKAALYCHIPSSTSTGEGRFLLVTHYGWPRAFPPPDELLETHPATMRVKREKRGFAVNIEPQNSELADFSHGGDSPRVFISPIFHVGDLVGLLVQRDRAHGKPFDASKDAKDTDPICQLMAQDLKETIETALLNPPSEPEPLSVNLPPSLALTPSELDDNSSPGEVLEGYRSVSGETTCFGTFSKLQSQKPVGEETESLPTLPGKLKTVRNGMFMPEQRTFFWEAASHLCSLISLDAVALWMDDDNQALRPVLAYSKSPLTPELKQQVLAHVAHHLPKVAEQDLRILTTVEYVDHEPLPGAFQTYLPVMLMTDAGAQDLMLLFKMENRPFQGKEQSYIQSIARLLGLHIQEIRLHERYHRSFLAVSHSLLASVEGVPKLKDQSLATAKLARSFGRHMELPAAELEAVCIAAILHDVGTSLLDPAILLKPGLTQEEMEHLRTHPLLATAFLKDLQFPFDIMTIIRHHHERWDGKGYPDGLKGDAIPMGSRIIHLVEAFSVMRLGNAFKGPKPMREILIEIKRESGKQFDPNLVSEFMDYLRIRSSKE